MNANPEYIGHILHEIVCELREIKRILKPKVHFELAIYQQNLYGYIVYNWPLKGFRKPFWRVRDMAAITAGATGVFQGVVTASDSSTVTATGWTWTSSDSSVTIAPDSSDSSGATVDVTVPASDTSTTFTLSATASATSTTSPTAQTVSGSISVTISPASAPVTFTLNINQLS